MSRPTHLLRHEHRVIEQAMRALEGICVRMRAGGTVPGDELNKLIDFIEGFADGLHHEKEERLLFPALHQAGLPRESRSLVFLCDEHRVERKLLGELHLAMQQKPRDSASSERFIAAALQCRDHLIGHMQQEDATLYSLAEEILDNQAKDLLTRALAAEISNAQPLIQRYEQAAEELEKAWAV
jgi:hemerythrin-like domain-containing protein